MRKRTDFILHFSVTPLLFFLGICVLRILLVFDFPFTIVVHSTVVYPAIMGILRTEHFAGIFPITLVGMFLWVWTLGTCFFTGTFIREGLRLKKSIAKAPESEDPRMKAIMAEVMEKSGRHTKVKLISSHTVTTPMVTGFFHPTIYLPRLPFSDRELRHMLTHEWCHYLNHDAWIKLFFSFLSALFWWNPFIHILKKNLDPILEVRCDWKVVELWDEDDRIAYLESLLKVLKYQRAMKKMAMPVEASAISSRLLTSGEAEVEQRFRLILEGKSKRVEKPVVYLVYSFMISLFLLSNVFILQPATYETPPEDGETFSISPEISYLINQHDGTYRLYSQGKYRFEVYENELSIEPFSTLTIQ